MNAESSPESSLAPGCARVRARLEIGLDGGLAPLESALDRGHLEACAACRAEEERARALLAAIRAVSAQANALELAQVESALLPRLAALGSARRVRAAAGPRRFTPVLAGLVAAGIALFALALGGRFLSTLPFAEGFSIQGLLARLPSWTEVARGLDELSRSFS